MLAAKYWRKNREDLLPWVKDWSDPQDHIRNSNNVRDMSFNDWFYCHPSAYSLIYYGTPVSAIVMFGLLAFISTWMDFIVGVIIGTIVCALFLVDLIRKIWEWDNIKNFTFYDLNMRDHKC